MIGVFDSGIGGLTVLKALLNRRIAKKFIYLGDTARLPYGTKSPQTIRQYLFQNIEFLCRYEVRAVVVACHTASSVLEPNDRFPIPVFEVLTPAAEIAARCTKTHHVAVLATRTTVLGRAYERRIQALNSQIIVHQQACGLWAPLVEEGWDDDPMTNLIVYRYLAPLLNKNIDTFVLGCTHYPVLKAAIQKVVGSDKFLVDSGEALADIMAEKLSPILHRASLRSFEPRLTFSHEFEIASIPSFEILTSDPSPVFHLIAQKLMNPYPIEKITQVNLQRSHKL